MNEAVILKPAFNRYCDLINDYNAKADETFLTSYNKKYMNDFIDIFEQIKRESGLNFNSEEAYGLLENEIKKAMEKINMAFDKEKSVYNTVFKNVAVAEEETRSKKNNRFFYYFFNIFLNGFEFLYIKYKVLLVINSKSPIYSLT